MELPVHNQPAFVSYTGSTLFSEVSKIVGLRLVLACAALALLMLVASSTTTLAQGTTETPAPAPGVYPDLELTHGVVETTDAKVVCHRGYTRDERHVTEAQKREVFRRYGLGTLPRKDWGQFEIDHFISLELGGSNDIDNLWPEPYGGEWGARKKDVVETDLHRHVCKGELSLEDAQKIIRMDWVAEYKRIKRHGARVWVLR